MGLIAYGLIALLWTHKQLDSYVYEVYDLAHLDN